MSIDGFLQRELGNKRSQALPRLCSAFRSKLDNDRRPSADVSAGMKLIFELGKIDEVQPETRLMGI